ncbi:MAG TPA: glycosyltransferase [bacterium (Candidatus Stahlbacteria)]|nr:glycosyltransferase [Candidatus Stahlbacteria bacterium]
MTVLDDLRRDPRVWKEAESLRNAGYDVSIIGVRGKGLPHYEKRIGIEVFRCFAGWHSKASPLFYTVFALPRAVAIRPHVYHSHDLSTLLVGYIGAKINNTKLIYDSHELCVEMSHGIKKSIWRLLEQTLIKQCNFVLTVNGGIAKELANRYNTKMPTVLLNAAPYKKLTREKKNYPYRIVYEGIYTKDRNLDKIIEAALYIRDGILVFVGEGTEEHSLKKLRDKLRVNEKVNFFKPIPREELIPFISSCDIGLAIYSKNSLNNFYATPNKLFEYIMAGIPIIGSNFPEMRNIIEGEGIGLTVNPDNPMEIASSINKLIEDESLYNKMQKNLEQARQKYNWEREEKKLIELYRKCLRKPS